MSAKLLRVARLLLDALAKERVLWPWLNDRPGRPGRKRTNKFFAGAVIDYQMRAGYAWDLAQQRTEIDLRDPDDLWGRITRKPLRSWNADWNDPNQRWHRFPKGHERVWRIGKRLLEEYDGDARNIWKGQSPTETLDRLLRLGVGEQISRMVVGALIDSKAIRGVGDVKADVHVRRVLGRVLTGRKFSEAEATAATRQMHSRNPWKLDAPLYFVGKDYCFESRPDCQKCDLAGECTFRARSSRVARRR